MASMPPSASPPVGGGAVQQPVAVMVPAANYNVAPAAPLQVGEGTGSTSAEEPTGIAMLPNEKHPDLCCCAMYIQQGQSGCGIYNSLYKKSTQFACLNFKDDALRFGPGCPLQVMLLFCVNCPCPCLQATAI